MKKKQNKLGVAKDTIRALTQGELHQVPGGAQLNPSGQGNSCVRGCTTDRTQQQM